MKKPLKALEFTYCDVYVTKPKEQFIGTCKADRRNDLIRKWCSARGLDPRNLSFKFDFKYRK